ncbi:hypothetical protein FOL47_010864 [Perkinsus chesapeaki]|uniref:Uncharacterized protein n=1 Tax=Perkinsus chesapeaki TaxID=330153 RepID=A0A7J6KZG9_PERCH|nr:hypothetical protein FOL47_010864 [Perkinsus chesapeaki]
MLSFSTAPDKHLWKNMCTRTLQSYSRNIRNDELIADMVKHWMNAKARRKRPKGIKRFAQGSVKTCPSVDESPELEVDIQQDDVGGDGPGRLRRKAYTKAVARFTELVDDEDEDEGS